MTATIGDLVDGLVGAYVFDEGTGTVSYTRTAHDTNATIDGATWTANGLLFDGADDCVRCAGIAELDLPQNQITIFARIYPHTTGEGGTGRIFNLRRLEHELEGGIIFFTDGTASLGAQTIIAGGVASNQRGAANQITLNDWNNVFCEYDNSPATKAINIFVGTTEISYGTDTSTNSSPATTAGGNPACIGSNYPGTRTFDGEIACVYVWSKILSAEEKALVNSTPLWIANISETPTYKIGLVSDIHNGASNSGTQLNTSAIDWLGDFVTRQNNTFQPNAVVILGDCVVNAADANAAEILQEAVLDELDNLTTNQRMMVCGNHDTDDLTNTAVRTLWASHGYEFEIGKLYSSKGSVPLLIGLDSNYDADTSGYPHVSEQNGVGFEPIIPDGTDGSDNQKGWLDGLLGTSSAKIVFVHHDLAAQDLTGNTYFSSLPDWVRINNAAAIRTSIEGGNAVAVIGGHLHQVKSKVINGIPYIALPSLVESAMRLDSNDKGQWAELSFYDDTFALINIISDDSTDGVTIQRTIVFPSIAIKGALLRVNMNAQMQNLSGGIHG